MQKMSMGVANARISDIKKSIFSIALQNISIVSIIIDIFKNIQKCQIISKSYGRNREKKFTSVEYFLKTSRKSRKCHSRFQIWMNFFMGNPPDVKSLFPEFYACGTSSFA
jgi:hypothetical protein